MFGWRSTSMNFGDSMHIEQSLWGKSCPAGHLPPSVGVFSTR